MKKFIKVVVVVLLLFLAVIAVAFYQTMSKGDQIVFSTVDLSTVSDGTYVGECEVGLVRVKAQVVIKDGKLADITLLQHDNGLGKEAEALIDVMIEQNTLDVDSVAGATISSKAIRKACESALSF